MPTPSLRRCPPTIGPCLVATLVVALVPSLLAAQSMTSEERIRSIRAASNAALEAGDVPAFLSSIDEDYVGTAGNGGHIRSRDAVEALVTGIVADPAGVYFVRTPSQVEVDPAGGRAIEVGRWQGYTRAQGGPTATDGGRYTAYWRRTDGRWLIHAELFVTLGAGTGEPARD